MQKIKQFVTNEYCIKCLGCCRFAEQKSVWSPQSIEPIQNGDSFVCPNLELENNKCKIYNSRPFDCELYPFLLHKINKKVYLAADFKCPFLKSKLDTREVRDYIKYLEGFFSSEDSLDFLSKNEKFILSYPEDIKVILELVKLNEVI